ncbi:hypothetical protein KFE25_001507 [Diacronema lutheri]|uniref:CS domain-containing protein n=1 Tax=Diacronema lutheri TaxID=2081491 RepID=A0A8J5XCI2_DIALT|nr:hypothetical protein KFE25_001507 [Diacronema lutheri]
MDYSKWDTLDVDEDEGERARPRVTRLEGPASFTIGPSAKRGAPAPPAVPARARVTDYNRWEEVARAMGDDEDGGEEEGGEEDDIDGGMDALDDHAAADDRRPGLGSPATAPAPELRAPAAPAGVPRAPATASTHGGVTARHVWAQTKSDVIVNFIVPAGTRAKDVTLSVERERVAILIRGSSYALDAELAHPVVVDEDPDELDWELREPDGGADGCRWLRVTLAKHAPVGVTLWWDRVLRDDAPVDVSAFAGREAGRAAQFEANWNEAHEMFRHKVATRQKVQLDVDEG